MSANPGTTKDLLKRLPENPIVTSDDVPWPVAGVYNPGITEFEGGVLMLVRVEDRRGYSNLHVARSEDGLAGWRFESKPLLEFGLPDMTYETLGCEDPRITWFEEDNCYYICYVAYSEFGPAVGLARTEDFESVERIGLVLGPSNKDTVMFPWKIDGFYTVLHRQESGGMEHIWSAQSPDLLHWGMPHCVLPEGAGPTWDSVKVGAGPPPIPTDQGWLLVYHGVKQYGSNLVYRAGLALLDKESPHRILKKSPGWVLEPREPYELNGSTPNVVFPSGSLVRDDELWVYYGAADRCVCIATARVDDLLDCLEPASR